MGITQSGIYDLAQTPSGEIIIYNVLYRGDIMHSRRGLTESPVVKRHQLNSKNYRINNYLLTILPFSEIEKKKNENRRKIKIPAQ